jgi:hypothetical protein
MFFSKYISNTEFKQLHENIEMYGLSSDFNFISMFRLKNDSIRLKEICTNLTFQKILCNSRKGFISLGVFKLFLTRYTDDNSFFIVLFH